MSSHHLQNMQIRQLATTIPTTATTAPANSILKFGNPGPVNDLFERTAYTVSYNRRDRIPYWVGEHLTAASLKEGPGVSRDKVTFKDDPALPEIFRAYTKDYTNSGYDRGHMAPAGDAVSTQQAMDETFLLTNIAPQIGPGFNRQYWAYFEKFCRDLTANFTDVYVYTGPLFLPQLTNTNNTFSFADAQMIVNPDGSVNVGAAGAAPATAGQPKYHMQYPLIGAKYPTIAVPTHFFKILLATTNNVNYAAGSFVLPNQAIEHTIPLSRFQVDISAIEKASGLQFFQEIDRKTFTNLCTLVNCVL
ncbi:hypothetical protein BDF20DRAFT_917491 [Mycotypha africana]|uniref:uncharacterized protein n=1 Tax=Mycotypha africana TaxID=64632 RepID=UPI0023013591|nr:uncharacterized protein BDF20DRAFT_917491 [Mycotypha africana]KAI8967552.1 hypothetical protein BDF20DRAFT_917491 [Mycotypha africana]